MKAMHFTIRASIFDILPFRNYFSFAHRVSY